MIFCNVKTSWCNTLEGLKYILLSWAPFYPLSIQNIWFWLFILLTFIERLPCIRHIYIASKMLITINTIKVCIIISLYGRGNGYLEKLNGAHGQGARQVKVWLGTQVCVTLKFTIFPPYHSAIQLFRNYNFWPKKGLWKLGLRSVVLVEQKTQYIILSEDEIRKVKIIYQVCPLIHCWENPAHYLWWEMNHSLLELKEPGIHVIQPSHFTHEHPGVH